MVAIFVTMLLIEWRCCEMRLVAAELPPSAFPLLALIGSKAPTRMMSVGGRKADLALGCAEV
jgi:hypothetical protein